MDNVARRPSLAERPARQRVRGQSLVEFCIVATIFFLLVSGVVDFGRALNAWIVVSNSAREGARQASVGVSAADVTGAARAFALVPGLAPTDVAVDVAYSATPPRAGDLVTVTVTAPFEIVTPLVRLAFGCPGAAPACTLDLVSATTMRYEGDPL